MGAAGAPDGASELERKDEATFRAGGVGALVAWVSGISLTLLAGGADIQPSQTIELESRIRAMVLARPDLLLKAMAWDGLFVTGYVAVFCALFAAAPRSGRVVAAVGLALGLLAGAADMIENALYVVYALGARNGVALTPDLPFHYYVSTLKWSAAFAAVGLLLLVFPRRNSLDRWVSAVMLTLPLGGALSTAYPWLVPLRSLFFVVGMPLFALSFFRRARASAEPGAA